MPERVLNKNLTVDKKIEKFLIELETDAKKYENVKEKIINKNWDLSLVEIARVGLSCNFIILSLQKQKQVLDKSQEKMQSIADILMEKVQNVDFSQ